MAIEHAAAEHFAGSVLTGKNSLRLGGSSYFVTYVLTGAVNEFKKTHPDLDVKWAEAKNRLLLKSLDEDELDLFIEVDDFDLPGVGRLKLGEETVLLAVPASYEVNERLADCRMTAEDIARKRHLGPDFKPVSLDAFKDYPFILLREGNDSHERALKMCANAGFVPKNVPILADQVMTSFYLSTEEYGISFIRDSILYHGNNTNKLYFYRPEDSLAKRNIYLYYSTRRNLPAVVPEFIEFMRNYRP